jgi:hypothetical protein
MAKVKRNIFIQGVSGKVGDQMIIRRMRGGGTIVCAKPTFPENREFSQAQLDHQYAFQGAAAYARGVKRDPIYLALAQGTAKTGYNVALGDWLNPPQVLEIDLDYWDGAAQDLIRARAQDDVLVTGVRVEISDASGSVLEAGQAMEAGALWWEYTVTRPLHGELNVTVFASDLQGNVAQASKGKHLPILDHGGG